HAISSFYQTTPPPTRAPLFPYTTLFRSNLVTSYGYDEASRKTSETNANSEVLTFTYNSAADLLSLKDGKGQTTSWGYDVKVSTSDRKSTRLNSSHVAISYAVFCLKKKKP